MAIGQVSETSADWAGESSCKSASLLNAMTEPGKNFGSMNMDEFLKNIWTAEESQAMAAAMGSSKTVDQVWKDIHRDSSSGGSDSGGGLPFGPTTTSAQERQTTFGEMTLEDFLMKAGVVREDAADIGTSQQQQGFSSLMGSTPGSPPTPDSDGMLSPMHYGMDGPFRGRKRGPDGPVEKVVERRQRRMIKNRESAARSRARKQAYTVELEAEVNQLKEENSRLRKQQLMEMMKLASKSMASKANVLRRTRTAMW
ncbi:unnamed protein product [Sphagnum balticum]